MIWVTCPRKWARFITKKRLQEDELWRWADEGFPDGVVVWNNILWVLAPDPGCEL